MLTYSFHILHFNNLLVFPEKPKFGSFYTRKFFYKIIIKILGYFWGVTSLGDSGPAHEVNTFPSRANDLHTGGILPIVYPRDRPATWSASIHSVGQRPEVYNALL